MKYTGMIVKAFVVLFFVLAGTVTPKSDDDFEKRMRDPFISPPGITVTIFDALTLSAEVNALNAVPYTITRCSSIHRLSETKADELHRDFESTYRLVFENQRKDCFQDDIGTTFAILADPMPPIRQSSPSNDPWYHVRKGQCTLDPASKQIALKGNLFAESGIVWDEEDPWWFLVPCSTKRRIDDYSRDLDTMMQYVILPDSAISAPESVQFLTRIIIDKGLAYLLACRWAVIPWEDHENPGDILTILRAMKTVKCESAEDKTFWSALIISPLVRMLCALRSDRQPSNEHLRRDIMINLRETLNYSAFKEELLFYFDENWGFLTSASQDADMASLIVNFAETYFRDSLSTGDSQVRQLAIRLSHRWNPPIR